MADASYDVVVIGGGTKSLVTAMYLAKYGGLDVAIFERKHELGGGYSTHEGAAPGFYNTTHASTVTDAHFLSVERDFPDFYEKGARFGRFRASHGIICEEDHSCFTIYHREEDPSGERSAREATRFASEKDAETFLKLCELNKRGGPLSQVLLKQNFCLMSPDEPAPLEKWFEAYVKEPDCLVDRSFAEMPAYRAVQQLWDSKALQYMSLRYLHAQGSYSIGNRLTSLRLLYNLFGRDNRFVIGGTHNVAHVYMRIIVENGGKYFTRSEVDKIIVENGTARGIRLADGTEVEARKLVVSGVDPYQLCIQFLGKEYFSPKVVKKIESLERGLLTLTWYDFAAHELPSYKAADFNPDINNTQVVYLGSRKPERLVEEVYWKLLGKDPPGPGNYIAVHRYSQWDKLQAPLGKHAVGIYRDTVAANRLTEREWMEFKRAEANKVIEEWQQYAPNMTWDNVIGYDPFTPYDAAKDLKNMSPGGSIIVVDLVPGQLPPHRPILELVNHKMPIKNLYATGSAWGNQAPGDCSQGYTCYKVIAEDLGLRKPWEERGDIY